MLIVKAITPPYIHSATVVVVEDDMGETARLTLWNLEDTIVDPVISEHDILVIKQPCWTRLTDGGFHLRVDHPSDFAKLDSADPLVPGLWRTEPKPLGKRPAKEWKSIGDMHFLQKRFRTALDWLVPKSPLDFLMGC